MTHCGLGFRGLKSVGERFFRFVYHVCLMQAYIFEGLQYSWQDASGKLQVLAGR